MQNEINVAAVIGAGSMGHGIAQSALLAGLTVHLYDIKEDSLNNGVEKIYAGLDKMAAKGEIKQQEAVKFKENLKPTTDLKEAVSQAQFVFEAVPEVMELKKDVFKQLDEFAPRNCILATNTSNMSITEIANATRYKERVVGVHFFIPVVLMKIVEVIRGADTSDAVMDAAYDLCLKMNKIPVRVEKDRPGFIVNRVNGPTRVFLSAVVDKGLATPEGIDALMRYHGLPIGHFELQDYIGLDVVYFSAEYRKKMLHPEYRPSEALAAKVNANELGRKTGKGFYDWSKGKPNIDLNKRTDALNIEDIEFVKFNEAAKLVEEEVAEPQDIDKAMVLGTGYKEGPIAYVRQRFHVEEAIRRLEKWSKQLELEILQPAKILKDDPDRVVNF